MPQSGTDPGAPTVAEILYFRMVDSLDGNSGTSPMLLNSSIRHLTGILSISEPPFAFCCSPIWYNVSKSCEYSMEARKL